MIRQLKSFFLLINTSFSYRFVFALFLFLLLSALEFGSVLLIPDFISYLNGNETKFLDLIVENVSPVLGISPINTATLMVPLAFLIKNAYLIGTKYFQSNFVYKLLKSVSDQIISNVSKIPYQQFVSIDLGVLSYHIIQEIRHVCQFIVLPLLKLAMNSFVFLSIIALLFYQIGVDFIYVFGVIGITFFVVLTLLQKASRIIGNKAMKFRESYSMFINQFLNGILELRLFKRSRFFLEIAQKRTSELSSAEIKRDFYSTLAKPIIEIVFISFLIITLAIELRTNDPVETIANFSLYLVAVYKLIPSINEIIGAATSIRFYAKSLSIVNSYLQKNNESNESESVYTYEELEEGKLIEFRDVTFGYDATKPIIKNLNLEVNRGDIIGISGPSGSGKSTMIMLFSGLFRPQKGQIVFNAKVFKEDVKFGYVSQKPFIFNQNLLKNISLTNDDSNADLDRVKESIKKAQLDIFTDEELSTKDLGENGAVLSGGQRQRVSIARAMYPDKEILIIDEATASLDRVTAQNILRAILYDGQLATLMITHRQEDLNFANKKLVFTDNDIKIEVND